MKNLPHWQFKQQKYASKLLRSK